MSSTTNRSAAATTFAASTNATAPASNVSQRQPYQNGGHSSSSSSSASSPPPLPSASSQARRYPASTSAPNGASDDAEQQRTGPNLLYCAVCRLEDRVLLAKYTAPRALQAVPGVESSGAFQEVLQRVLGSRKIADHKRLTIEERQLGLIHYDTDGACMYVLFARSSYPQRMAFQFLGELRNEFVRTLGSTPEAVARAREGSLSKQAKPMMSELCKLYDRPQEVDKASAVRMQVDQVKGTMHDNINQVIQNTDDLENLQTQSEDLRSEATAFQRSAGGLERNMWWRNCKLWLIIAIIALVIIAFIVVPIVVTRNNNN